MGRPACSCGCASTMLRRYPDAMGEQRAAGPAAMRIVDLGTEHVEQARRLAAEAYAAERDAVPALPAIDEMPDLTRIAESGLGVAALEDDEVVGFLGCTRPREGAFGQVRGTFAPTEAHGTVVQGRARTYDRLYQAASDRWVTEGILSHVVGLYALHDGSRAPDRRAHRPELIGVRACARDTDQGGAGRRGGTDHPGRHRGQARHPVRGYQPGSPVGGDGLPLHPTGQPVLEGDRRGGPGRPGARADRTAGAAPLRYRHHEPGGAHHRVGGRAATWELRTGV